MENQNFDLENDKENQLENNQNPPFEENQQGKPVETSKVDTAPLESTPKSEAYPAQNNTSGGAYYAPQPIYINPNQPNFYGQNPPYQNGGYAPYSQGYTPQNQGVYYSYPPIYPPNPPTFARPFLSPQQIQLGAEKKALKKAAGHIGFGILLFYIVMYALSFIVGFGLGITGGVEILSEPAFQLELNVFITLFGFISAAILIFSLEKSKPAQLVSYGLPKAKTFFAGILLGIGWCTLANFITGLIQTVLEPIFPIVQNELQMPEGVMGFVISVISVAVAPALLEEFLFRGAIMGTLLKFGKGFAIFTSALLFGLIHGNLVQIPFAFMVGIILGVLTIRTGSIWTAVIVHFLNNFISVCLDYLSKGLPEDVVGGISLIIMAVMILLGLLGFFLLYKKDNKFLLFEKTPHISTSTQRFGWLCSSATIIVIFVIVGIEVLITQLTAGI